MTSEPFKPHPNLSNEINKNIIDSEILGGVWLRDIQTGISLSIKTQNRYYTLEHRTDSEWLISGHPVFCGIATPCRVNGSTWGGSMLKMGYIGRGMHLEFVLLDGKYANGTITTSAVEEITVIV